MGRVLALDFGTRRVGAAVSDPGHSIATPLEIYERRDAAQDARHYRDLVRANDVARIVIGLPLHTGGREGTAAVLARDWGAWLSRETSLEVIFVDERYTTVEAEDILIGAGMKRHKRKGVRDMLAAQILLQAYLDAGCPDEESPAAPLYDLGDPSP